MEGTDRADVLKCIVYMYLTGGAARDQVNPSVGRKLSGLDVRPKHNQMLRLTYTCMSPVLYLPIVPPGR
jgi:hypothetical protein